VLLIEYLRINKEFIVSKTASRVYRYAASCSLSLPVFIVAYIVQGEALFSSSIAAAFWELVFFAGVFGTGVNLVAMEIYLFMYDESAGWKQIFYFLLMCFVPIGAAIYCFSVYSRSSYFKAVQETELLSAS
jgi:hypothetical protein